MAKLLEQADEAAELAKQAFAAGDAVTGIAALQLSAELVQLAKIRGAFSPSAPGEREDEKEIEE